jgi:hypothetical protein
MNSCTSTDESGVRAAVDDVHHRHGQDVRVRPADVAEQLQPAGLRGRLGHGQRDPEDRVGAEARLVRGAVQVEQPLVDDALVDGLQPGQLRPDLVEHGRHGLLDALAPVPRRVAVAQLHGLVLARRRPRRDGGRASVPSSSATSTSTVGLPRESRISRAPTCSMTATTAPRPRMIVFKVPPRG